MSEIKDKFKIKHIEKIAHILFSIKVHNTVIDFLIFPQIDRQFSISKEKIKEWKALVKTLKNESLDPENLQNGEIPCFLKAVSQKYPELAGKLGSSA